MIDHPRFHMAESAEDQRYRQYYGAPQVELVFRLVDSWLSHKRWRPPDERRTIQSASEQQAVVEQHSLSTLQLG